MLTGNRKLEKRLSPSDLLPVVHSVLISFREVLALLRVNLSGNPLAYQFDYHEYMLQAVHYIVQDEFELKESLAQSPCRTMLRAMGYSEERIFQIEHEVLTLMIALMSNVLLMIYEYRQHNQISGYFYEITSHWDLIIRF